MQSAIAALDVLVTGEPGLALRRDRVDVVGGRQDGTPTPSWRARCSSMMVGKTVYVSGKGDYSPQATFAEKVKNCLNEVRKTLQVGGMDMQNVVQSWVYLEDTDKFDEFNKVYREAFKDDPPVRTTIGVKRACRGNLISKLPVSPTAICPRESGSANPRAARRTVPRSWPATHFTFRARGTNFPAALIRLRLRSKCGNACAMPKRVSSWRAWTSGMSS